MVTDAQRVIGKAKTIQHDLTRLTAGTFAYGQEATEARIFIGDEVISVLDKLTPYLARTWPHSTPPALPYWLTTNAEQDHADLEALRISLSQLANAA